MRGRQPKKKLRPATFFFLSTLVTNKQGATARGGGAGTQRQGASFLVGRQLSFFGGIFGEFYQRFALSGSSIDGRKLNQTSKAGVLLVRSVSFIGGWKLNQSSNARVLSVQSGSFIGGCHLNQK